MRGDILVHSGSAELGAAIAERMVGHLDRAAAEGAICTFGWPAGRTPLPVLDALAGLARDGLLDLSHARFAMMDEYLQPGEGRQPRTVPLSAHNSCRGFAEREIGQRLNASLPPGRRLAADALLSPDPSEPAAYDEILASDGGVRLFLVAVGASDGHVAFNPPGTPLASTTRVVRLAETTRRDNLATFPDFGDLDRVPTHGVSVGLATIARARELAVVLHGASKREAARRTVTAHGFDARWPASFVHGHSRHAFFLDRAAAVDVTPATSRTVLADN
ncbi:6-phosphogluconolactonase [Streptomyces sp. NPDC059639]|uniref:6-phosphogluconolactonase n=1 Tax=Streptomyces sp. NPDC059639 TaxID=3346891 RepID=UPI003676C806